MQISVKEQKPKNKHTKKKPQAQCETINPPTLTPFIISSLSSSSIKTQTANIREKRNEQKRRFFYMQLKTETTKNKP